MMAARFERHVKRRARRCSTGLLQGNCFGVWSPTRLRVATADDDTVLDEQSADGRIGRNLPPAAPGMIKRRRHETYIFVRPSGERLRNCQSSRYSAFTLGSGARIFALRGGPSPGSSPCESSSISVLKSRASRKFR